VDRHTNFILVKKSITDIYAGTVVVTTSRSTTESDMIRLTHLVT